jgi:hypothetical protein
MRTPTAVTSVPPEHQPVGRGRATLRRSRRVLELVIAISAFAALASPASSLAASLDLNPSVAPSNATITASGAGFGGSCGVQLQWETLDGEPVEVAGQFQVGGGFSGELLVPFLRSTGDYVIRATGLSVDAAGRCTAPNGIVATAIFFIDTLPPPPAANLTVSTNTVNPGALVKLDASGSTGNIKLFQFDLNGDGDYETKCSSSAAGVVNTQTGNKTVGVQVVDTAGQKSTQNVVVNVTGGSAPPPPKPGGGSFGPIGGGGGAGGCGESSQSVSDLLGKAYTCPGTVFTGVAVAAIPQGLPGSPCFERVENSLLTHWHAQSTSVTVNGLPLDTLGNHLDVYDVFKALKVDGKGKAQFKISKPGFDTTIASNPFVVNWKVAKPGLLGNIPLTSPFSLGKFLGLPYQVKDTPLRITGSYGVELDLYPELPLPKILFASNGSANALSVRINNTDGIETDDGYTLKVNDVYAGLFTLKDISVTYQRQGGSDFWGGGFTLDFPSGVGIGGQVGIRDGVLENLSASINPGPPGIGPIGCCLFIVQFGGQLTNTSISADATFAAGPEVAGNRVAQAHGTATIFYDPFEFLLSVDDLRVLSYGVDAKADVSITLDSFDFTAYMNESFGPFSFHGNVGAKVGDGYWGVSGSGGGCVNVIIDACVDVKAALGPSGIAGCGILHTPWWLPDLKGGAIVYWGDGFEVYWGCSMGKVKGKAGAASAAGSEAGASAGRRVRVPRGLGMGLFAIQGAGGQPQVRLKGPHRRAIVTPPPGVSTAGGRGWSATRATPNNTTYVAVRRPPAGMWKVTPVAGSPAIAAVGFARNLPQRVAHGSVKRDGPRRTLTYRVTKVPGTRVVFFERGGPDPPTSPGESVDRVIGIAKRARGQISFRPAESRTATRRIDAVIESQGVTVDTETIARFRAPRFGSLRAPKVRLRRKGSTLLVRWSRIGAAQRYHAVVDLTTSPSREFETFSKQTGLRIAGITPITTGTVEVRAISPGGHLGAGGTGRLNRVPPIRVPHGLTTQGVRKGIPVLCTASGDGTCTVEVRKGSALLASGAGEVGYATTVRVLAKLTKAGRKALRKGSLRATVTADVPSDLAGPVRIRISAAKRGKKHR